jgi:superfamily II DNA or RNA helicase
VVVGTNPSITALCPYQEEAIAAINDAALDGITRPLMAMPTGTGKTVVFSHLIDQRPGPGAAPPVRVDSTGCGQAPDGQPRL